MEESFYDILGVSNNASHEEIKKSFRNLSMKYHPDKNSSAESTQKFQKLNEAYQTLGDQEKRSQYDLMQQNPFMKMGGGFPPFSGANPIDEILKNVFSGGPMPPFPGVHVFQTGLNPDILRNLSKPPAIIKNLTLDISQILEDSIIPIEIERWVMDNNTKLIEKETIYVDIPKGVDNNEIIFVRNRGNKLNESSIGDIKLIITINNNTNFKREGLELIYNKNISLKEALCGFSFEITYLNGKKYTINNKKGNIITPNYRKIIPNMGIKRDNHIGNLIIVFNVIFPDSLSNKIIDKIENIL
jgi:DnaJ-class molecular chaperone